MVLCCPLNQQVQPQYGESKNGAIAHFRCAARCRVSSGLFAARVSIEAKAMARESIFFMANAAEAIVIGIELVFAALPQNAFGVTAPGGFANTRPRLREGLARLSA